MIIDTSYIFYFSPASFRLYCQPHTGAGYYCRCRHEDIYENIIHDKRILLYVRLFRLYNIFVIFQYYILLHFHEEAFNAARYNIFASAHVPQLYLQQHAITVVLMVTN